MKKYLLVFVLAFFLFSLVSNAQESRVSLEQKRKQLQAEIDGTYLILEQTQLKKELSLKALNQLTAKVKTRETLIVRINAQLTVVDQFIDQQGRYIHSLQSQLQKLKNDYAKMVEFAYLNRRDYSMLMFVFAADDYNQAYKRLKYIQKIAVYRRGQAIYMAQMQKELNQKLINLDTDKKLKGRLLQEEKKQQVALTQEKNLQSLSIRQLQGKEQLLRKELAQKQKEQRTLNNAIQMVIRKQGEQAQKAVLVHKKAVASRTTTTASVSESKKEADRLAIGLERVKLSASFLNNKGKLPWPVQQGVITEDFGRHPHPLFRKVMNENIGINIKTGVNLNVTAVFNGQVIAVQLLYGQYAVIIKHGDYFTTYAKLKSIRVSKGQIVKTGQIIGAVASDADGPAEIQFIVTKGTTNINPAIWLSKPSH